MQRLLLLRHAKSSWKDEDLTDFDRPLNKRGKRDAPQVGEWIQEHGLLPDLVLCSSARRTRETVTTVMQSWESKPPVLYLEELYHADPQTIRAVIETHASERNSLLVVGHNPGLQEFLEELTGEYHRFPTAALAWLEFSGNGWAEGTGAELRELWRPGDQSED